jgi:hypothetical protein
LAIQTKTARGLQHGKNQSAIDPTEMLESTPRRRHSIDITNNFTRRDLSAPRDSKTGQWIPLPKETPRTRNQGLRGDHNAGEKCSPARSGMRRESAITHHCDVAWPRRRSSKAGGRGTEVGGGKRRPDGEGRRRGGEQGFCCFGILYSYPAKTRVKLFSIQQIAREMPKLPPPGRWQMTLRLLTCAFLVRERAQQIYLFASTTCVAL